MSKMCIKVEFLAGTDIKDAIQEAKTSCIRWDLAYVQFSFNGVSVSVRQQCDVEEGVIKYHNCMRGELKHIIV